VLNTKIRKMELNKKVEEFALDALGISKASLNKALRIEEETKTDPKDNSQILMCGIWM